MVEGGILTTLRRKGKSQSAIRIKKVMKAKSRMMLLVIIIQSFQKKVEQIFQKVLVAKVEI